MSICLNQLDNIALQVQDIVIGIKGSAIGGIFQCKRLSRLIIDEIKDRCQGVIRFNCLSGNFSVQCKILMRDRLRSGDMGSLRGDGFIFSRIVISAATSALSPTACFDRGNRSFVWFKRSLPFWGMGRNLLKVKVSSLAGINPLQIISQPILHPCSRPIDKSRQLQ